MDEQIPFRGGSWRYGTNTCRAAYVERDHPEQNIDCLGFRLMTSKQKADGAYAYFRGGAWLLEFDECRSACRPCFQIRSRYNVLGLRLIARESGHD